MSRLWVIKHFSFGIWSSLKIRGVCTIISRYVKLLQALVPKAFRTSACQPHKKAKLILRFHYIFKENFEKEIKQIGALYMMSPIICLQIKISSGSSYIKSSLKESACTHTVAIIKYLVFIWNSFKNQML